MPQYTKPMVLNDSRRRVGSPAGVRSQAVAGLRARGAVSGRGLVEWLWVGKRALPKKGLVYHRTYWCTSVPESGTMLGNYRRN